MAREHPFPITIVDTDDMSIMLPDGTVVNVSPDTGTIYNYMDGHLLAGRTEDYELGKTWFKTWEPELAKKLWVE